ncbi:hypothetical protein [Thermococcus sp. 5-4]|uniref:hypothetical protein n=1 Tax=Thermococcus sp. 5-4 TaxID=2008440 RepID=UPI000B499D67|nr:hypothetical protein [Thermococcus sp. 5-4]ASA77554.1 hypothetical protein CDI07_04345 [Thermococcus sp. 5-4]
MGPYFPQYVYAETPGYVEYVSIALWLVLLTVVALSTYRLNKTLSGMLAEVRGINASAVELMKATDDVEKMLEEV